PFPESFQKISGGFIPNIGGGEVHLVTIGLDILLSISLVWIELKKRSQQLQHHLEVLPLWVSVLKLAILIGVINYFMYKLALYKGLPTVLVIVIALIIIYTFIMNNTVMGRHIYATGGNRKAADLSGIKTKRVVFWVFVNNGVLAA